MPEELKKFPSIPKLDFTLWRAARKKEEEEARVRAIENAAAGDVMPDGTIYAGISPDTHKRMFVTPEDARLSMNFNDAAEYAKTLNAHGHNDWRIPTKDELNIFFDNREKGALAGTFNQTNDPGDLMNGWRYWYRSSTPGYSDNNAWIQDFSDGHQNGNGSRRFIIASVRCVR